MKPLRIGKTVSTPFTKALGNVHFEIVRPFNVEAVGSVANDVVNCINRALSGDTGEGLAESLGEWLESNWIGLAAEKRWPPRKEFRCLPGEIIL